MLDILNPFAHSEVVLNAPHFDGFSCISCLASNLDFVAIGVSKKKLLLLNRLFTAEYVVDEMVTGAANFNHIAASPACPFVVISCNSGTLIQFDAIVRKAMSSFLADFALNCSKISPDHNVSASVGDIPHLLMRDLRSNCPSIVQNVANGFSTTVDWSPDGRCLAIGSQDCSIG